MPEKTPRGSSKRGSTLESTPEGSEYSDTDLKLENLQSGFRNDRRRSSSIENYRQEGLLRRLREAQGFIEEVVAEKELLIELLHFQRALHYWRLGGVLGRGWRQLKCRTEANYRKKLMAKAMGCWALLVSGQQHLKFSISNLILSRENSMTKATLLAWAFHVRNVQQNSVFVQSMIRRKNHSCCKTGFEQWYDNTSTVKSISSVLVKRASQRRRELLGSMLSKWYAGCVVERKHNKILHIIAVRTERRDMKAFFAVWIDIVRRKRKMTKSLAQLLFRTNTRVGLSMLGAWFEEMCLNRKLRRSAETLIGRGRKLLLSRSVFTWLQVCRRKLGLYGKLLSKESRTSKTKLAKWFSAWTRYVVYETKTSALINNRAAARGVAALVDAMAWWRGLSQEAKRMQRCARLVETRRGNTLTGQCLQAWFWLLQSELEAVDAEKAAARKVEAKIRAHVQALCSQAWRRWLEEARSAAFKAEEAETRRTRSDHALLRGVLSEWVLEWNRQGRSALEISLEEQQVATLSRRNELRRVFAWFQNWRAECSAERQLMWAKNQAESWMQGKRLEIMGVYWEAWVKSERWRKRTDKIMGWMAKREEGLYKAEVAERWKTAMYESLKSAAIVERSNFLHNLKLLMKPFLVLHFSISDASEERRKADIFRYKVLCGACLHGWFELFWWRRQTQVVAGRFARRAEHWATRRVKVMLEQWAAFVELVHSLRRGQARACLLLWTNTKRESFTRWANRAELMSRAKRMGREAIEGRALRAWHDSMGAERGQRILDLIAEASFTINGEEEDDPMQAALTESERMAAEEAGEGGWDVEAEPGARLSEALRNFANLRQSPVPDSGSLSPGQGAITPSLASRDSGSRENSFEERRC